MTDLCRCLDLSSWASDLGHDMEMAQAIGVSSSLIELVKQDELEVWQEQH